MDPDTGSEFVNWHCKGWCDTEKIELTRSRPNHKNDNAHVEQKNYTVVRRHIGYQRLEGEQEQAILNELYHYLRLYVNYFQPSMRLASKERIGAAVKKTYSPAETPYKKLGGSPHLTNGQKQILTREHEKLNPAELKRRIETLREKLLKTATRTRHKIAMPETPRSPWHESNNRFFNQKHLE